MRTANTILALGLLTSAHASRLFVSSYSGTIATVELSDKPNGVDLVTTFLNRECESSPSWLQWDSKTSTLYCADEGNATPNKANLTSLRMGIDGSLTRLDHVVTANGGVSTDAYMVGKDRFMAVAHYGGSGISIVNATDPTALELMYAYAFVFNPPRGDPTKPIVPFIHQVVVDPTGSFLLAPDLSGDEVHVFGINEDGKLIDPPGQLRLTFPEASGPRHLAFYQPNGESGKTYVYVVMEKANLVYSFEVSYADGALKFNELHKETIFGGEELPAGSAAGEITITPDNKFLIISSRGDKLNPAGPSNPGGPSDTLVTFSLDAMTGIPKLLQKFSAGGIAPRSFAINKAGDRVAVALATSNRLVILSRDVKAGTFTAQLGSLDLEGGKDTQLVTSVVWQEESDPDIVVDDGGVVGGGSASSSAVSRTTQIASASSLPSTSIPRSSSSGEEITVIGSESSAAGSSFPSSDSSEEDTTITMRVTSTVTMSLTKSRCQQSNSLETETPTPTTLTKTLSSVQSSDMSNTASSSFSIVSTNVASSSAGSTSQMSSSTPLTATTPTPTRFPFTTPSILSTFVESSEDTGASSAVSPPGYFATMIPGSVAPAASSIAGTSDKASTDSTVVASGTSLVQASTLVTATPSPVRVGIVPKCQHFYQVKKGDTCEAICTAMMVPKKSFWTWNGAISEECKDLKIGEWVCVGI